VGANQFAERGWVNEPGADFVILDAGVDDRVGIGRRNEDGGQRAAACGVRDKFARTGDVGTGGEARTAHGKNPVPELKNKQFHFERDKFQAAGLTPMESELVKPARASECPVHMEARVRAVHELGGES
jgi:hypothetical protein